MLRVYLLQPRLMPWYTQGMVGITSQWLWWQPVLPARTFVLLEEAVWNLLFYRISKRSQKNPEDPISVLTRFLLSGPVQIALSFSWSKKPEDMIISHNDVKNTFLKMFHRKSETWRRSYRCASYVCELSQERNFDFIAYVSGTWARGRERSWDVLLGKWRCGSSLEILDITSIRELRPFP